MFKKFFSSQYAQGALVLTLATFLGSFINYLFHSISGKTLGPSRYGEIVAILAYINILSFPIQIISLIITQNIANRTVGRQIYSLHLESWFKRKLRNWFPVILLLFIISPFMPHLTNLSLKSWISIMILISLSLIVSFYNACFQANKLFLLYGLLSLLTVVIKFMGPATLYLGIGGPDNILIFLVVSSGFAVFLSIYFFKKIIGKFKKNAPRINGIDNKIASVLNKRHFTLTSLSVFSLAIFGNIDIVVTKRFFELADSGTYAAWTFFAKVIFYLTGPFIGVLYVFFSSKKNAKFQKKIMFFSQLIIFGIGFILMGFYLIIPKFLITLFYDLRYTSLFSYLKYAAIYGLLYSAIIAFNNYFLAKKSRYALILFILLPIYLFLIIFFSKMLFKNLILINIYFSLFVFCIYLAAFLKKDSL